MAVFRIYVIIYVTFQEMSGNSEGLPAGALQLLSKTFTSTFSTCETVQLPQKKTASLTIGAHQCPISGQTIRNRLRESGIRAR